MIASKAYLILYNALSALAWLVLLFRPSLALLIPIQSFALLDLVHSLLRIVKVQGPQS